MTDAPGLHDQVEAVFMWQHRTGGGLRGIPITVTWQHRLDADGGYWVPVKFAIDGDGQRIGPGTLQGIRWSYVIASTDPDNKASPPEPYATPPEPAAKVPDRRAQRPKPAIPEPPADLTLNGATSLAFFESLFGPRAYNALRRNGYHTLEAVLAIPDAQLSKIDGVGEKTVSIIRAVLDRYRTGYAPPGSAPESMS